MIRQGQTRSWGFFLRQHFLFGLEQCFDGISMAAPIFTYKRKRPLHNHLPCGREFEDLERHDSYIIGKQGLFPVPGDYDPRGLGKVVARPHIRPVSSRPRCLPDGIPGRTRVRAPVARCSFEPEDAVPWPRQPQGEGARRSTERHLHFDPAAARWSGHQVAFDGESSGTPSVERGSIVIS